MREELQQDPHFNYFAECQHEMELALPILEKVYNKTLSLYDYTLSPVHTQALENASKFFENFVNRILLDNCGVSDGQFASIVTALLAVVPVPAHVVTAAAAAAAPMPFAATVGS